jgi:acetylornithine deacetylase/succinyl-diaminopimelate desuccinylase-like protein
VLLYITGSISHANTAPTGAAELLFAVYQQLDPAGPAATTAALEQVRRGYMNSCLSCLRQSAHTAAAAPAAAVAAVRALSLLEALLDDSEREKGDRGLLSHAARQRGRPVKLRLQCTPALLRLPTATATATVGAAASTASGTTNGGYSASAGVCMGPANRPGAAAASSTNSGSELLLELRSSATLWDVRCRVAAAAAEAAAAAAAQDAAGSDDDEGLSQQIAAAAEAAAAAVQPQEVVLYCGTRLLRDTDNGRTLHELGLAGSSSSSSSSSSGGSTNGSGSDATVWRAEKAAVAYSAQGEHRQSLFSHTCIEYCLCFV